MDYKEAWSFLDELQFFKIKLGLESMTAFLDNVGKPHERLQFIHVGGTNGKGSVAVNLLTILAAGGYKVGLYTSPHLSSVRERFRINNTYISEEEFAAHATAIRDSLGSKQITYFEFTTALAMLWFAEQDVDLVIMEVGLGGRLDATNVIKPLVSIITNVSMDHEAHLGNSLGDIAYEKAGIVKPGVPVVSGVAADESLQVVEGACLERGSLLHLLGRDFHPEFESSASWTYRNLKGRALRGLNSGLAGNYQVDNCAMAIATLELLEEKGFPVDDDLIRHALADVQWPGRLESFCLRETGLEQVTCEELDEHDLDGVRRYLLDGAHNPAGVKSLLEYLGARDDFRDLVMVWANMSDKDYVPSLLRVAPYCRLLILTRPEEERSAPPEELKAALPPDLRERAVIAGSVENALETARQMSDSRDLICVSGSLYLVGVARQILLGDIV
ncbi:MAG: folylpolyglutamate synthase/dihydrofolate synthase family protein [Thermodesulfobacteriota bacterium]